MKLWRLKAGISATELARAIGVSQTLVSKWESKFPSEKGTPRIPSTKLAMKVCRLFGISLDEFVEVMAENWKVDYKAKTEFNEEVSEP